MHDTLATTITSRRENSELIVGKPQALDFLVPARILLDERVGARDVGFRLVIIEVADEVFDGVAGEKAFELGVKLRGERLVVRNDERGLVHVFDDVGDGERFARAGDAEQHLMFRAGQQPVGQLRNRLRLVPGGFVRARRVRTCHAKLGAELPAVNAGFRIETVPNLRKLLQHRP